MGSPRPFGGFLLDRTHRLKHSKRALNQLLVRDGAQKMKKIVVVHTKSILNFIKL